jgi:hypothetical protein
MTLEQWFQFVKDGGAVSAVLLLGAVLWLDRDRKRLIADNKSKDDKLVSLSERTVTVMTEIKTFLFSGKAG